MARLARRHKAAAAAVAGVAVSLVAAVIGISAFAVRAERARVEADAQRAVADRERDATMRAREAEAEQRAVAEAESMKAKRRLYVASLAQLRVALDRPGRQLANDFFREATEVYRDGYGGEGREPIELAVMKPSLDGSLAVLKGHEAPIAALAFSPDGMRLATGSMDRTARIWGISNAEMYRHRLASAAARGRLAPSVDEWFKGDLAATKAKLAAAKATMPEGDWHEAANLVLIRATRERLDPAAAEPRDLRTRATNEPGNLQRRLELAHALFQKGDAAKAKRDFAAARRHYEELRRVQGPGED